MTVKTKRRVCEFINYTNLCVYFDFCIFFSTKTDFIEFNPRKRNNTNTKIV